MIEVKGQRSLRVTVDAKLSGLLFFVSNAQDIPLDHLVESLILTALAGEAALAPHELEAIDEVSRGLLGLDLAPLAKKRVREGILTGRKPPQKPVPPGPPLRAARTRAGARRARRVRDAKNQQPGARQRGVRREPRATEAGS